MALIKSKEEIVKLKEGGRRLAAVLRAVASEVRPGITAIELDSMAEALIRDGGDLPAFKNYRPAGAAIAFPATLCVSINDEVVHGIPTDRRLVEGDIVGLDLGIEHEGLFTDMAISVPVGRVTEEDRELIRVTKEALDIGLAAAMPGNYVGDIGAAIEKFVKPYGFGIVRDLGGHGVGHEIHEHPYIPNFGKGGRGVRLEEGMVLAIEPMLTRGGVAVKVGDDDFTFKTRDGSRAAHFEHTIAITKKGNEVLTL